MVQEKKGGNLTKVEDKKPANTETTKKKANDTAKKKEPTLAQRMKFFQDQAEKVALRHKYQTTGDKLDAVEIEERADYFATDYSDSPKFQFIVGRSTVLSISNPEMVAKVRDFVKLQVVEQMQVLDSQIMA